MKYWYQKPNQLLSEYVRTVLILEGFSESDTGQLPLSPMECLPCFVEPKRMNSVMRMIIQLTLFGRSGHGRFIGGPAINTTIIAYFFKPFALATIFNVAAAKKL